MYKGVCVWDENEIIISFAWDTIKPVSSCCSKKRTKLVFKTDYGLMQVKEFCNTFDLH